MVDEKKEDDEEEKMWVGFSLELIAIDRYCKVWSK
jgi:hypothetical protein